MPQALGTVLWMLLVVAMVLTLAWGTARWIGVHGASLLPMGGGAGDGRLEVLRQIPLGRGERLAVVRAGGRCLLLGVGEGRVCLLTELTGPDAEGWGPGTAAPSTETFLRAFRERMGRPGGRGERGER